MLFCTSLVALVGAGDRPNASTRKLSIINTKVSTVSASRQRTEADRAHHDTEAEHHLRAHVPDHDPRRQAQPQAPRRRPPGPDLHLRHCQHEVAPCARDREQLVWCVVPMPLTLDLLLTAERWQASRRSRLRPRLLSSPSLRPPRPYRLGARHLSPAQHHQQAARAAHNPKQPAPWRSLTRSGSRTSV